VAVTVPPKTNHVNLQPSPSHASRPPYDQPRSRPITADRLIQAKGRDMGVVIRAAGEADRDLVVRLLDEAFQDDPVSGWVFPGTEYRRATHHRLMAAFTDIVLAEGRIDLTEDGWARSPGSTTPTTTGPCSSGTPSTRTTSASS
jgi:hypothetical protein